MINFISKSSEFIELLICEEIAGLFLFKRNEKKNRRGTVTPKMPFAARFSCCATINFNSILKYFPRGLWWQILYQNLWNLSNYWSVKKSRGYFCFNEMRRKSQRYSNTKNAFRCQILVLRDGGAYVSCKMYFSNSSGVHPLVGCTVSAGISSPNA